jgi:hypothetical protein
VARRPHRSGRGPGGRQERVAGRDDPEPADRRHPRAGRLRDHGRGLPAVPGRQRAGRADRRRAGRLQARRGGAGGGGPGDPRDGPRRAAPVGDGRGDHECLSRARPAREAAGPRRRGPEQRDGGGPPGGELRRAAGDVPERPGRGGPAGGLPALPGVLVHRPRHRLPREPRVRPPQGRALGRGPAHGAIGPGRGWRHVLDRHRDRLPADGPRQRRLGAGGDRRPGHRRPGRVPGLQAAARPGPLGADRSRST